MTGNDILGAGGRQALRPLAAGLGLGAVFAAVVVLVLDASASSGLTAPETSTWIAVLYGLPSLLTVILIRRFRQPLVVTGNVFIVIFVGLLGGELTWPELVGATMVAGAVILILGASRLTDRLTVILPAPIVYGLLAGAVLDLITRSITGLGTSTVVVGATFAAYFLSRAFLGDRFPALLSAMVVGVLVALLASETGPVPSLRWPRMTLTPPEFSVQALLTATPVLLVFIALQANAPSVVYLRSQGYRPPERLLSVFSGAGTFAGSVFGPMGVSLSLPATALVASPEAGEMDRRHLAGYVAAGVGLLIALMSGFASSLFEFIPQPLLLAIVGAATLGIFAQALQEITRGPLLVGPVVAFAVSMSGIELMGLGRFFWALVFGLAVSGLLEREQWKQLRTGQSAA